MIYYSNATILPSSFGLHFINHVIFQKPRMFPSHHESSAPCHKAARSTRRLRINYGIFLLHIVVIAEVILSSVPFVNPTNSSNMKYSLIPIFDQKIKSHFLFVVPILVYFVYNHDDKQSHHNKGFRKLSD